MYLMGISGKMIYSHNTGFYHGTNASACSPKGQGMSWLVSVHSGQVMKITKLFIHREVITLVI
jgi:hypothetical protein